MLKGHSASSQRAIILVKSTQIRGFSRWSGRGGWSGRAVAQRRQRFSKLGLKGLSKYYSNEIEVKAARQGASGPTKRATLMEYLLKRESWTTALRLIKQGQKAAHQRKIPLVRKSYSL